MLWAIGFLVTFLFGGLTGVILASPPLDFHVSDSYFVVAHFHYVVFGTVVFAMFAGFYFWWPKMTGRMLDERLGKIHFWTAVHRLPHDVPGPALAGRRGHAAPLRRLPAPATASPTLNTVSTIGAFLLGASTLPFLYNVWKTAQARPEGRASTTRGAGAARWSGRRPARRRGTTSSTLPRIRSESPGVRPAPPGDRRAGHADEDNGPARPRLGEPDLGAAAPEASASEGRGLDLRRLRASSSRSWRSSTGVLVAASRPAPPRWP